MATSAALLLVLLLLGQLGPAGAHRAAVVCAGSACYTAHGGKLSAAEAQLHCSRNGGNLATVRTEAEAWHVQRALAQLLQSEAGLEARNRKFWIGLQREKGKCLDPRLPLKGFSWVGGGEDTLFTNWHKEVRSSCTSRRCVSLQLPLSPQPPAGSLAKWSEGPCGSLSVPVSNIEGFVCKFSFKGMCQPLALGGPGRINYTTPFQATSSSLEVVPFASVATVACGDGVQGEEQHFLCREKAPGVFGWGNSGPLCVSPGSGCSFNQGGCQQECLEGGDGSFRCGCGPGFRLLDDLVTCESRNPCSSGPCTGMATCVPGPHWEGFACHCPQGYQLDASRLDCVDVDECQASPCPQECVNVPGGFRCECWVGYEPAGPGGGACRDVDECAPGRSPCAQECTNTAGSFHCSCAEGYVPAGEDSAQCRDVDECADPGRRLCDSLCLNTEGSFRCGCLPGWELGPDGASCAPGPTAPAPAPAPAPGASSGPPQGRGAGDRAGDVVVSAPIGSPTGAPAGASAEATATKGPSLAPHYPVTPAALDEQAPSGPPGVRMEPSTPHPRAATGRGENPGEDFTARHSDEGTDGQKLLLFYILGTVVAILLLLALALGLLVYRKRRAKKHEDKEKKPQNTADSYSWAPERAEGRALENQYSPTPGTDC